MKKLLIFLFICSITTLPAMAVSCPGLLNILEQYCDAEGYKYANTSTYAYGTLQTFGDGTVSIGCYKFKNTDHKKITKAVAKACNISESKVTIQTDLKRDDKQVQCKDIDQKNGITELQYIDGVCAPTKCLTPRWELSGNGKRARCIEQKCEFKHGTGNWVQDGDTWECKLTACDTAKGWKKNNDNTACIEMLDECTPEQKAQLPNATKTGIKKGTETCIAQECECGYDLQNGRCDNKWSSDKQCTNDTKPKLPKNAKSANMICNAKGKATCEITACQDGYDHNTEKNKCTKPGEPDTDDGDDQTQQNEPRLSESDSQAKVDELRDNAQAMRDKEQSTANKLLGAAGIGATGIGGMQMASAMAEQSADEDAETAMRAYLATFHCNYGGGQNIPGGKTNVELPGGNELIDLYSEYVNLANDLKVRKTALDMRPGIESESILDAATSGLYDDVAIGKTSGAYTSLARALMDPNGADAAAWAQQKAETADKKKTGMITAGIGAAGSLVGNLAINSGKDKQNKLDEILNKYDKKKQLLDDLQSDVAAIPAQTAPCPDGTTGTAHPNCTCTDPTKIYNPNSHTCEECNGGRTIQNDTCECPTDKPYWNKAINVCTEKPATNPTLNTPNLPTQANLGPVQTSPTPQSQTAVLSAGSLFKINSSVLRPEAQTALKTFITGLSTNGYKDCTITVNGYTDPVGNETSNLKLSQNRAVAVKKYIEDLGNSAITEVTATGHGEEDCTCGAGKSSTDTDGKLNGIHIDYSNPEYKICKDKDDSTNLSGSTRYAPCRRVEISAECIPPTTTSQ